MKYLNGMSNYLKEGFAIPEFAEYAKQCLTKLEQKLNAPCYAVDGEQACLDRLHEHIKADPYRWFESRTNLVSEHYEKRKAKPLTRLSDPLLYECVQDACTALRISNPSAFTFSYDKKLRNDTTAIGHTDTMWIFISEQLRENELLSDLELCFVIGCALAQAAAHHADVAETQALTPEQYRVQALTADRAGFLAVLWRTARKYPSLSADELVHKACDVSAQVMRKIDLYMLKKDRLVTPQALQQMVEKTPVHEKHARKNDLLPTVWERTEALRQFAVSIHFVRCVYTLWGESHLIVRSYNGMGLLQKNISNSVLE